ncbi:hypothetical protein QUB80_33275 [Chlorogloeopsis sp. ULAP01]|uniref:hypothetical protein n=1 Tax=Chlorogloeopsis sp. ULAP01 TaxID=3056483 RepID=UPI0025AAD3C4|nr:hypothetical protein [Chlorogloeopsis sp. ULAP01]MDM9385529.1 hypothetical protein [Chlorogloeopsis sp. ULAP01]
MKYLNVQQTDTTLIAILDELTATQAEVVIVKAFQLLALYPGRRNQSRLITIYCEEC